MQQLLYSILLTPLAFVFVYSATQLFYQCSTVALSILIAGLTIAVATGLAWHIASHTLFWKIAIISLSLLSGAGALLSTLTPTSPATHLRRADAETISEMRTFIAEATKDAQISQEQIEVCNSTEFAQLEDRIADIRHNVLSCYGPILAYFFTEEIDTTPLVCHESEQSFAIETKLLWSEQYVCLDAYENTIRSDTPEESVVCIESSEPVE